MQKITQKPSPNFDVRGDAPIDILLLHYTGMPTGAEALERLCNAEAKVSAHYFVDEDGSITQMVDEEMRAWHAGVSYWEGETNINARSIGIEIVNPGHEFGYTNFPDRQIDAVIELAQSILARHPIPAQRVIAHSDVAPDRKEDPGEKFPWKRLAGEGIGLWVDLPNEATPPDNHSPEMLRAAFEAFGYKANTDDVKDLRTTLTAFQRHYVPSCLNAPFDPRQWQVLMELNRIKAQNSSS